MKNCILPHLVTAESARKDFRVWSAGCSSGEEPYTLAMIFTDYFGSEKWKRNYFRRINDEKSVLVDNVKKEVIFRKLNLMDVTFPFKKKFHMIFYRNVMIYFDNKTRKELVNKFYEFTEPGGDLFIGHSESLNHDGTKYKYVLPAIYRKD